MIDAALAERERQAQELARVYVLNFVPGEGIREWKELVSLLKKWGAVCANEALEKAAQHEPKLYCAAGPISGVNNTYTIAFSGCTCGWNSDGEAAKKETWSSHIRALKAEG